MDRSVGKSQEINLSVSTSTLTHDSHATANPNNPAEFVNHGLHLWNQIREQWRGHKRLVNQPQQLREPKLNWNATYDSLFGSNKPLPEPIPLAEVTNEAPVMKRNQLQVKPPKVKCEKAFQNPRKS